MKATNLRTYHPGELSKVGKNLIFRLMIDCIKVRLPDSGVSS